MATETPPRTENSVTTAPQAPTAPPANAVKSPAESATEYAAKLREAKTRTPLSLPSLKLQVPEIEGWFRYWFRNDRIRVALQAGYIFVERNEVTLNSQNVGDDRTLDGNTDLGDHVSLVNGTDDNGNAVVATLMKIPLEIRQEDQAKSDEHNARIITAIFPDDVVGPGQMPKADRDGKYVKTALLQRPVRRTKLVGPR